MRLLHAAEPLIAHAGGAFVPTMGALHEGHAALIRRARTLARPVVVSIFVNPTQFAAGEDLARYPRTLDADRFVAEQAGADILFVPANETVYPPERAIEVPPLPPVATAPGLEDAFRPTHFAGVCQVVARLLDLVRPSQALFGEKDWQQLQVVQAMVAAERPRWGEVAIVAHPTVREPDGLAMSSRNRYLAPERREKALGVRRALERAAAVPLDAAERVMGETLAKHGFAVDYAVVRNAQTLVGREPSLRALIAARLDGVRLIDNCAL